MKIFETPRSAPLGDQPAQYSSRPSRPAFVGLIVSVEDPEPIHVPAKREDARPSMATAPVSCEIDGGSGSIAWSPTSGKCLALSGGVEGGRQERLERVERF